MADATGTLFQRVARVTIALPSGSFSDTDPTQNALVIEADNNSVGLRIVFKIVKTKGKEPNVSEITIYNLSPTSRAKLQQKGVRVLLEAGYSSTGLALVFVGDVRTVDHLRDKADWKTVLKCGDGERSTRFARVGESFAGPCTVGDVVRYCVKQMGLALGNSAEQAGKLSVQLAHGWTAHGAASTELDRVLRAAGYTYSVQDGQVQILQPGQAVTQTVPDVTPTSGLIGSPEMGSPEQKGKAATLKYKTLLMPQARPGGRNHIKSERYDGVFRTMKVTHAGDTRGGDWYSDFESVADSNVKVAA